MRRFEFIKAESTCYSVSDLCRVLQVSRSGYYEWLDDKPSKRAEENAKLSIEIASVFDANRGVYGRRRIAMAINKAKDQPISINRVARRMGDLKIAGYTPPSLKITTIPDILLKDSPNLVQRTTVSRPNQIWVSDITYIATREGWLYLCTIIDLFSRKVVGWSTRSDMKIDIVLEAIDKAYRIRRPDGGIVFHSDKGGQYKAKKFRRRLQRRGFKQSMTGVDHCYDNAVAESFFGTLKTELIRGKVYESREQAEAAIFEYIEVFYNRTRLHSSLGYHSPEQYERNIA